MFQSNQITTAHRPLVEQTDRPETAQFSPRKYSSRHAPILPRRKVLEASAPSYLTTEYRKSPAHASRVPRGSLSHWVRICKLTQWPAAVAFGFVFSKPPTSPQLGFVAQNAAFQQFWFRKKRLLFAFPAKTHEISATGTAPCNRDSAFSPICCRHNA